MIQNEKKSAEVLKAEKMVDSFIWIAHSVENHFYTYCISSFKPL